MYDLDGTGAVLYRDCNDTDKFSNRFQIGLKYGVEDIMTVEIKEKWNGGILNLFHGFSLSRE